MPEYNLKLDWSTAKVDEGELTVSLDSTPDPFWSHAWYECVSRDVSPSWWLETHTIDGLRIVVGGVTKGNAAAVRGQLDAWVANANTDAARAAVANAEKKAAQAREQEQAAEHDEELTDFFRASD